MSKQQQQFCLTGTGLADDPCDFATRADAEAALETIGTDVTQSFCVTGTGDQALASDLGAACTPTEDEAATRLDGMMIRSSDTEVCVVCSAGEGLGCFLDR